MKHKKLRISLAVITSLLVLAGAVIIIYMCYKQHWDSRIFWICLVLGTFLLDAITSLALFNSKRCTDETKSFWLFIILVLPWCGFILYLFLGKKSDRGYSYGVNNQTILLSAILRARKSIKIYTNSIFLSYDTERAINYITWNNVPVTFLLSYEKKKWKRRDTELCIKAYNESNIKIYFTNKEIKTSFIIIDDKKVLVTDKNFNYKYMYSSSNIAKTFNLKPYIDRWNEDMLRTTQFKFNNQPIKWYTKLKYSIINIFYMFF